MCSTGVTHQDAITHQANYNDQTAGNGHRKNGGEKEGNPTSNPLNSGLGIITICPDYNKLSDSSRIMKFIPYVASKKSPQLD